MRSASFRVERIDSLMSLPVASDTSRTPIAFGASGRAARHASSRGSSKGGGEGQFRPAAAERDPQRRRVEDEPVRVPELDQFVLMLRQGADVRQQIDEALGYGAGP